METSFCRQIKILFRPMSIMGFCFHPDPLPASDDCSESENGQSCYIGSQQNEAKEHNITHVYANSTTADVVSQNVNGQAKMDSGVFSTTETQPRQAETCEKRTYAVCRRCSGSERTSTARKVACVLVCCLLWFRALSYIPSFWVGVDFYPNLNFDRVIVCIWLIQGTLNVTAALYGCFNKNELASVVKLWTTLHRKGLVASADRQKDTEVSKRHSPQGRRMSKLLICGKLRQRARRRTSPGRVKRSQTIELGRLETRSDDISWKRNLSLCFPRKPCETFSILDEDSVSSGVSKSGLDQLSTTTSCAQLSGVCTGAKAVNETSTRQYQRSVSDLHHRSVTSVHSDSNTERQERADTIHCNNSKTELHQMSNTERQDKQKAELQDKLNTDLPQSKTDDSRCRRPPVSSLATVENTTTNVQQMRRPENTHFHVERSIRIYALFSWIIVLINMIVTSLFLYGNFFEENNQITTVVTTPFGNSLPVRVVMTVIYFWNSCAWVMPTAFCCGFCAMVRAHFTSLAEKIDSWLEDCKRTRRFPQELEEWRQHHSLLCHCVTLLDRTMSKMLMTSYVTNLPLCIFLLYVIVMHHPDLAVTLTRLFWFSCNLGSLLVISIHAALVHEAAHSPLDRLFDVRADLADSRELAQLQLFISRLTGTSVGFTALGIIVVTKEMLLTLGGLLITYFIVLLQFQIS